MVLRTLPIRWQRLVSPEGRTCPRCAATGDEVQKAIAILDQALPFLGIRPELETSEIDTSAFRAKPEESNRITIADRTIEEWLGGHTSGSRCCSVCGDSECRTVEVGGVSFEAIPERLILKAALLASVALLDEAPDEARSWPPAVDGVEGGRSSHLATRTLPTPLPATCDDRTATCTHA